VPGILTGLLLRSLKRLCFLDTDTISSQFRDYRLPDISGSRKQIAMGRPVNCFNKHRWCPNPQQFLQWCFLLHFSRKSSKLAASVGTSWPRYSICQ